MLDWHIFLTTGPGDSTGRINVTEPLQFTVGPGDWVDESNSRTHCNSLCGTSADLAN